MTNVDTAAKTAPVAKLSPIQELAADYAKTKVLVYRPGDPKLSLFGQFMATLKAGADYFDWTGKAPDTFGGVILAKTKDDSSSRLIAFADKQTALSDPVVQDALYDRYIKMIIRTARNPDASEGQFITPSGAVAVVSSMQAFKFQSSAWVELLKKKGLKGIQVNSLKLALSNASMARALFPTFKDWDNLLKFMAANAEKNGLNTSLFAHWAATRDAAQATSLSAVALGDDVDALLKQVNDTIDAELAEDEGDEA